MDDTEATYAGKFALPLLKVEKYLGEYMLIITALRIYT